MTAQRRGTVLFLSSIAGQIGSQTDPPYSASKAAVMRLTENLAVELKEHGVFAFALRPGFVRTQMSTYQTTEEGLRWLPDTAQRFKEEKNVPPTRFRVKRGQFLYIGDVQLDVDTTPEGGVGRPFRTDGAWTECTTGDPDCDGERANVVFGETRAGGRALSRSARSRRT